MVTRVHNRVGHDNAHERDRNTINRDQVKFGSTRGKGQYLLRVDKKDREHPTRDALRCPFSSSQTRMGIQGIYVFLSGDFLYFCARDR